MVVDVLIALAYLGLSAAGEVLSVKWQSARECGRPACAAWVSVALGVNTWIPILVFVATESWLIIVADLVGNWIGSYWGVGRYARARVRSSSSST